MIYADDSTIFQEDAQGAQEMADGVSEFAAASGTIVKPEKSHSCQNKCEDDVYVTTWSFIRNFGLGTPQRMALTDTTGESMRRLGNTQDIMGSAAVAKKIVMEKVKDMVGEALRHRLNAVGVNRDDPVGDHANGPVRVHIRHGDCAGAGTAGGHYTETGA